MRRPPGRKSTAGPGLPMGAGRIVVAENRARRCGPDSGAGGRRFGLSWLRLKPQTRPRHHPAQLEASMPDNKKRILVINPHGAEPRLGMEKACAKIAAPGTTSGNRDQGPKNFSAYQGVSYVDLVICATKHQAAWKNRKNTTASSLPGFPTSASTRSKKCSTSRFLASPKLLSHCGPDQSSIQRPYRDGQMDTPKHGSRQGAGNRSQGRLIPSLQRNGRENDSFDVLKKRFST